MENPLHRSKGQSRSAGIAITYPCPKCSADVPVTVRAGVDWWTVRCIEQGCGHEFQLWRCPGPESHVATFRFYEEGEEAGHECLACGHRHRVARTDDRCKLLRSTVGALQRFAPHAHQLLEVVQGALRHRMSELNPGAEEARVAQRYRGPVNRKQRRIVDKAAEAVAAGKLTKSKALKLQRGLR